MLLNETEIQSLQKEIRSLIYVETVDMSNIYKPKKVGRRTDRYKRYFGARTPPMCDSSFLSLIFRGKWSSPAEK